MRKFLLILSCFMTYLSNVEAGLWYVKGSGGVNFIEGGESFDINPGYYLAGSLGHKFSRFFRVEGEGAYRNNNLHMIFIENVEIPFDTPIHTWTAIGNALLDFPCVKILSPYIGGGIGAQWVRSQGRCNSLLEDGSYLIGFKIQHDGFAYQGIAGIGVKLGTCSNLTIDYRYLNGIHAQANHTLSMSLMCNF